MPQPNPYELAVRRMMEELGDYYGCIEDVVDLEPTVVEDEAARQRLHKAGVGLATILFSDGHFEIDAYTFNGRDVDQTCLVVVRSMEVAEQEGQLPPGSFAQAAIDIRDGVLKISSADNYIE